MDDFSRIKLSNEDAARHIAELTAELNPYMHRWKHMCVRAAQRGSAEEYEDLFAKLEALLPLTHLNWLADQYG